MPDKIYIDYLENSVVRIKVLKEFEVYQIIKL